MNERIPSIIRWTRSDYARLSYAVRQFNKKVIELEKLEDNVAPPMFDYSDVKENIYSRKELNRVISSLKRISRESQQRIVETPAGEKITQWEYSELKKAQKRSVSKIQEKAREIIEDEGSVMGDTEYKRLMRTRESIEDLFNRVGSEFRRTAERTLRWGKKDFDLKRAEIYRKNFMNSLEEMKEFDNYDILYKKLKSIENPIQFYNYVKQSDILSDLFLYYKDKATAQTYGGFDSNQEAFNTAIFDQLGITRPEE